MTQKKINIAIVGLGFGAEFIPIYQAHWKKWVKLQMLWPGIPKGQINTTFQKWMK